MRARNSGVSRGRSRDIVLVAHERPGSEHLGIRMVAAALLDGGYRPHIVQLLSLADVGGLVARTLDERPLFVGVSISDPLVAPLMLTFVRCLRRAGYTGHITAGGALATLLRADLMQDQPDLDSIIRHAGEGPALALARSLERGRSLAEVPGLSTRDGEGRANLPLPHLARLRPLRAAQRPRVLGIPSADVSASRGCAGRCAYCGVAALQRDLEIERSLPGPRGTSRHLGIQRRLPDDVAEEVAELRRQHGVRVVRFVDDNLLGSDESQALAWLADFERGLAARRTGRMAFRLMVEPGVISDAVADALAHLGFVSILVGIESLTDSGLRSLGWPGHVADHLRVLDRLTTRGIAPVVNVLALRPGGSLQQARSELEALAQIDHIAWDVLPLMAWPGTRLSEELAARGELAGRGLGISWKPPTQEGERLLFAVERLRSGGPAWLVQHPNLVDVGYGLRPALRLEVPGASARLVEAADQLIAQAQRERRAAFEELLVLAETQLSAAEFSRAVEGIAQGLAARMASLDRQVGRLLDEVDGPDPAGLPTPSRSLNRFASLFLAGSVLIALAGGCGSSHAPSTRLDAAELDGQRDLPPRSTLPDATDAAEPDGKRDLAPISTLPDATGADDVQQTVDGAECSDIDRNIQLQDVIATGHLNYSDLCNELSPMAGAAYGGIFLILDSEGRVVGLRPADPNSAPFSQDVLDASLAAMVNDRWPCLAGQTVRFVCMSSLIP